MSHIQFTEDAKLQ